MHRSCDRPVLLSGAVRFLWSFSSGRFEHSPSPDRCDGGRGMTAPTAPHSNGRRKGWTSGGRGEWTGYTGAMQHGTDLDQGVVLSMVAQRSLRSTCAHPSEISRNHELGVCSFSFVLVRFPSILGSLCTILECVTPALDLAAPSHSRGTTSTRSRLGRNS